MVKKKNTILKHKIEHNTENTKTKTQYQTHNTTQTRLKHKNLNTILTQHTKTQSTKYDNKTRLNHQTKKQNQNTIRIDKTGTQY